MFVTTRRRSFAKPSTKTVENDGSAFTDEDALDNVDDAEVVEEFRVTHGYEANKGPSMESDPEIMEHPLPITVEEIRDEQDAGPDRGQNRIYTVIRDR